MTPRSGYPPGEGNGPAGNRAESQTTRRAGTGSRILSDRRSPQRIQLRRVKGWCKPPDAVVVTRASKHWGNPFKVEIYGRDEAIRLFRLHLAEHPELVALARHELAGRDLACVCPLDQSCHADVWLAAVNDGGWP